MTNEDKMPDGIDDLESIPLIVVIGSIRGGTSCTAGVLHKLGVCMGRKFQPNDKANPTGYFEAMGLKNIVLRHIRQVRRNKGETPIPKAAEQLAAWGRDMRTHVLKSPQWQAGGGKHPKLSFFGREVQAAWMPNLYVVRTRRPIEDIVLSVKSLKWGGRKEVEQHIDASIETFKDVPEDRVYEMDYDALIEDPVMEIATLSEWLPFNPTGAAKVEAVMHVDPAMKHLEQKK